MLATALTRAVPLAFAAGLNVYATVAVIGLVAHFNLVALPEQFRAFDNPVVIGAALTLYVIEFVADKIPWFDSIWDAIHTAIRPIGGVFIALTALGHASPTASAIAALVGGSVAMTTHATKAGTRAAANTSPEPFSNWFLSLGEDAVAISISYLALKHPILALTIAAILLAVILLCASFLIRAIKRRFAPRPA